MSRSFFSLLLLAVGASVFYLFFLGQWNAMKLTRADYNAANFAIDQLEAIAAKTEELRGVYNNISAASLKKAERMIPESGKTASLIADLELLAARNGVRLRAIDFNVPVSSSGLPAGSNDADNEFNARRGTFILPVSLQVSGRYDSFRRFLADLELHERLIDITTINFAADEKDDAAFSIRGNVYYQ